MPKTRELIDKCFEKELYISFLTVANAAYIMRKYPKSEINRNIRLILKLFSIAPNDKSQIENAINIESPDFEDMLQYQTAMSVKCDVLLTRNIKDFTFAKNSGNVYLRIFANVVGDMEVDVAKLTNDWSKPRAQRGIADPTN